ncbi:Yippee-like protein [Tetrabaena socialis]|uniref:Protein yippee-like n=1 Tax=Tetrabaena socialis TaxID=47790 RepID=A0A2J8ABB9_9CHLO|nr:Yippee-like protein [Tetrabaena socialis]|eukprot:PNH09819.1 Yippee-like protein [Tetrabaena socialis]
MGRPFVEWFEGRYNSCAGYSCKMCRCNLASSSELVSRQFHSKHGRAYLFNQAVNLQTGPREERMMTTGLHVVCDVYCSKCMWPVGWKYELAYEKSQKYKEGKVILERACVVDVSEDGEDGEGGETESDDY